jgi:hypothetical protein
MGRIMKRVHVYVVLLIAIGTTSLLAAPPPLDQRTPDHRTPDYAKAQALLDEYSRKTNPTVEDGVRIGVVNATGLKPTSENVLTVQRLLANTAQRETKIRLIRLLGSLYTYNNESGQNVAITNSLRSHISSTDTEIARTALYAYSAIGVQSDWVDMLDLELKKGILTDDAYSQELALGMAAAPAPAQITAASRLAAKNSAFGAEVLASSLHSKNDVQKLAPESRKILLEFLQRRAPVMPTAIGEYSMGSGLTYARWLELLALLTEFAGQGIYAQTIFVHLNAPNADPRNILGYLTSPQGERFMKSIGQRSTFAPASAKALALAKQFPSNRLFSHLGEHLEKSLSQLPQ